MAKKENLTPREIGRRANLEASIAYADRLEGQIETGDAVYGLPAKELALLIRVLLTHNLAVLEGKAVNSLADVEILLKSAAARLGYSLVPEAVTVAYYEIEIERSNGNPFSCLISCPSNVSMDAYITLRNRFRKDYKSHRIIEEISYDEAESRIQVLLERRRQVKDRPLDFLTLATGAGVSASTEEIELVEFVQGNGLLAAYEAVVDRWLKMVRQPQPKSIGLHFLSFLRSLGKPSIPQETLKAFVAEFGGRIEVYQSNGIAMILSDGEIRRFCISAELKNYVKIQGSSTVRLKGLPLPKKEPTDLLHRTRLGYVPAGSKIFFEALMHFGAGNRKREMRPVSLK